MGVDLSKWEWTEWKGMPVDLHRRRFGLVFSLRNFKNIFRQVGVSLGPQSLQYGVVTLLWHRPERQNLFNLTILKHQNIKMSKYKVDKKHCVMCFFSFSVPVRKI